MNKDGVLVQLAEYLGAFRCHANLFGEIAGIVAKSGYERNFLPYWSCSFISLRRRGKIQFALPASSV